MLIDPDVTVLLSHGSTILDDRSDTAEGHADLQKIFADNDYTMSLIRARMDTLESRHAVLTERFFRRNVLHEASCLHYLLPDKRDSSVTDRLRHAKTFQSIQARTNKLRNSFLPFCLQHFD